MIRIHLSDQFGGCDFHTSNEEERRISQGLVGLGWDISVKNDQTFLPIPKNWTIPQFNPASTEFGLRSNLQLYDPQGRLMVTIDNATPENMPPRVYFSAAAKGDLEEKAAADPLNFGIFAEPDYSMGGA